MKETTRNRCLSIRTTDELSKELERYEDYLFAKGTVAHTMLAKIISDLSPDDIRKFVRRYPDRRWRLKLVFEE